MNKISIILIGLTLSCCTSKKMTNNNSSDKIELKPKVNNIYQNFRLYYSYAGLGSGMGSMQPVFEVKGKNYVYTNQQNSSYGNYDKKPKRICTGTLRSSSIDSILNVVKDIKDTLIYRTNVEIMSGGIHSISVEYEKTNVNFNLHNAYDSNAQKIVDILNTNIPYDKKKLWIFSLPEHPK